MIIEKAKNLLSTKAPIIAHQVNCRGIMGAGVAKEIKNNILPNKEYQKYQEACKRPAKELMGSCMLSVTAPCLPNVMNLFAEDKPTGNGLDTDYQALRRCFETLMAYCKKNDIYYIAIPGYIGCGLAGGDWNFVFSQIICPIFEKEDILLEIDYLSQNVEKLFQEAQNVTDPLPEMWHGFPPGTPKTLIESYLISTFVK